MSQPFVSVVIPGKNAEKTLKKCLDSVMTLNYPCYEVIFVNDGSIDSTVDILNTYKNIKVITTNGVGPSIARNMAVTLAAGEYVAFTDADCIVNKDWLSELLKGFKDEKTAGVGGIQKSPDDETYFGSMVQEFLSIFGFIGDYLKSGREFIQTKHNPSCNVMYRKSILVEVNGFRAGLWPGEDVELDYRITKRGYKLVYSPLAIVYHYRSSNLKGFSHMMFRYGRAQGILVALHGFFRLVQSVPVFLIILFTICVYNFYIGFFVSLTISLIILAKFIRNSNFCILFKLGLISIWFWNIGFLKGLFEFKNH
jgi:cellulose synthase/poly-beta-1,6-N-acetylglucosamine synthase-like glycosyltransferase